MTDLILLPENEFQLYWDSKDTDDAALLFPSLPIHPEVISACKAGRVWEYMPEIRDRLYALAEKDMKRLFAEDKAEHYLNFAKGRIEPIDSKPYLIQGVFSINCDSTVSVHDADFFCRRGNSPIDIFNDYTDNEGMVTCVISHNARSGMADPVLHRNWAMALNNVTLKKILEETK